MLHSPEALSGLAHSLAGSTSLGTSTAAGPHTCTREQQQQQQAAGRTRYRCDTVAQQAVEQHVLVDETKTQKDAKK